jgi:RimJ/RimL family protein N-acetyltransferase
MQSPSLQAATASEPLTLDEEYAMQRSWRSDADKLTFIICLPKPDQDKVVMQGGDEEMIGDINLFLSESEDDDKDDEEPGLSPKSVVGEIELMIAVTSLQRKGYGRVALLTFLSYVLTNWSGIAAEYAAGTTLEYLRVRINAANERSIALFASIGFKNISEKANYFGELELRWKPELDGLKRQKAWEDVLELHYEQLTMDTTLQK